MTFEVTILGSSSATPAYQRNPAAQVLNYNERLFLIDCGEATQIQMNRFKVRPNKIQHIFISHLHGDHYLGLMGLLATFHLQGRTADVHLHCQEALKEILDLQFKVSDTQLRYPLHYHFSDPSVPGVLHEDEDLVVSGIPLNHRIPCQGFVFREKRKKRNLIIERVEGAGIPVGGYATLKDGMDYRSESGKIFRAKDFTTGPRESRSYAYVSDTLYDESILPHIEGVNLLYHEATFMNDMLERAKETFHTTSLQAGIMAKKANVQKLLLGHFSARYRDLKPLLEEAKTVFENSFLALEGDKFAAE